MGFHSSYIEDLRPRCVVVGFVERGLAARSTRVELFGVCSLLSAAIHDVSYDPLSSLRQSCAVGQACLSVSYDNPYTASELSLLCVERGLAAWSTRAEFFGECPSVKCLRARTVLLAHGSDASRRCQRQTDGRTDGRTDRHSDLISRLPPPSPRHWPLL